MTLTYDEPELVARLASLDRSHRTAFAAACAERLAPLFDRYAVERASTDRRALRTALDQVWQAIGGSDADLRDLQGLVEDLVPDEDDQPWSPATGYAENAAAAVAYAIRAWLTDDAQEAAWGALQVYEAADYAAQQSIGAASLDSPERERDLLEHPVVQMALAGVLEDLDYVESQTDFALLARRAVEGSQLLAAAIP